MKLNCIFNLLIIIGSKFNLHMVCTSSSTIDNFLRFSYTNSSCTYQLVLQQIHNCLLMFSILCCTIYSYMLLTFTTLCVYALSYADMFHTRLSYDRYWIFWNIYICTCAHTYVRIGLCLCTCPFLHITNYTA